MKRLRSRQWALCAALAATLSAPAGAQEATSFQVERFEPLPAQRTNVQNLAASEPLADGRPSFGVTMHFVDDPLQVRTNDEVTARLVDDQLKAELSAAYGLFGFADVGFVFPVVLFQSSDDLTDFGNADGASAFAAGDLRLVPRVRLLNPASAGGVGVAVLLPFYLPTGATGSFNGDGGVRVEPRLAVDWQGPMGIRVLGNLAYQLRSERVALTYVSDDILRYGAGVEVPVPLENLSATAGIFGDAVLAQGRDSQNPILTAPNSDARPLEAQLGVRYAALSSVMVHGGGGFGVTSDVGSPDFRIIAGVEWSPDIGRDSDDDDVPDVRDACPDEAEDVDGFEDGDGCPELDNDGDGIKDSEDRCMFEAEDVDSYEDSDGCPEPDNDRDGLLDGEDECPDFKGTAEYKGCPDTDLDGMIDKDDQCPEGAEDFDGFQDEDGCPDNDNDGDGLSDGTDSCRDEAEVINLKDDEDGCPDEGRTKVNVTQDAIELLEDVRFSGSRVRSSSRDVLDQVAAALKNHSRIELLRIEVHDESSRESAALERAAAVRDHLVDKGIDASRLEPAFVAEAGADGKLVLHVGTVAAPAETPAEAQEPEETEEEPEEEPSGFEFDESDVR